MTLRPVVERLAVDLSVPVLSFGRFKVVKNTITKGTLVSVPYG